MKVIVWDVDDVLNDLMGEWLRLCWKRENPQCSLEYSMITSNPPHELLGVAKEIYLKSLDAFRQRHFKNLQPLPEMLEWFGLHGNRAHHIALTSVPIKAAHYSAEWVFSHFGKWIRSFNIVPSPRPEDPPEIGSSSKADYICSFSRADIVVEDNPDTLTSMKNLGIRTVPMPRPWNRFPGVPADALAQLNSLILG